MEFDINFVMVHMTKNNDYNFINQAFKLAITSDNDFNARVGACIVFKNRIVSYGYNHKKTHPFQTRFAKNSEAIFFHAEVHAIKNALRFISISELAKCSLYIARMKYDKSGKEVFGMSKPCSGCARCIDEFEIKRIVYTNDVAGITAIEEIKNV
jgi:deoxycytidylate deaminase